MNHQQINSDALEGATRNPIQHEAVVGMALGGSVCSLPLYSATGDQLTAKMAESSKVSTQAMAAAMGAQASAPSAASTLAMCMVKGSGGMAPLSAPA